MDGSQGRTEFAQKQRSISEHHDEEDEPSSWDPPTTTTRRHCASAAWRTLWKLLLGADFNMEITSWNWF